MLSIGRRGEERRGGNVDKLLKRIQIVKLEKKYVLT